MPRFLVDESSGKRLFIALKQNNYDVLSVAQIMPGASDPEVLEFAEKENRILITNDKDFGELIYRLNKSSSGVILLRLKIDNSQNRIKYLFYVLNNYSDKL
jgi:predicted nuclease of predicted toxin-antitoxin system